MYSTRIPEETPFLEDFEELDRESESFRFVATMTRMHLSERTWSGREGRMNAQMIKEEFPAWKDGIFYVAGPPKMVETMLEMLAELNVPKERLHIEKFMGY
jgi:ferredoxin-NADP reductase